MLFHYKGLTIRLLMREQLLSVFFFHYLNNYQELISSDQNQISFCIDRLLLQKFSSAD